MLSLAFALLALTSDPAAVDHERFQRAASATTAMARATRGPASAAPGLAVIMVREGEAPTIYVDGVADAVSGRPATAQTPFYIASMTKAYVGLMAETLDRRGVFDLDQSLHDVWPDLTLPERDPTTITFRQLLTHQGPFRAEVLSTRTAYVDEVPAADYPRLLALATPREPGFEYQNTGYLIYGAALEARTGKHWRRWLQETVFDPLGMDNTSTRMSFPGASATHHWIGDGQWDRTTAKTDPLMHAAGGMVTSAQDMARWLEANLDEGEGSAAFPTGVWTEAHRSQVENRETSAGLECRGYALGWNTCVLGDEPVLLHGGGYTGARSLMAVAPELGVAIAVMANSDSMTGELGEQLVRAFLTMASEPASPPPDPDAFGQAYADRLAEQGQARLRRVEKARQEDRWGGWGWTPAPEALDVYVGAYRHATGDLVVARSGNGLTSSLGQIRRTLEPASTDLFAAQADPFGSLEAMAFTRTGGRLDGVVWGGDRYERVEGGEGAAR